MSINLPLDKMTLAEKLEAMEAIWLDLSGSPLEMASPVWHADVLADRKSRATPDAFQDWADAKREIRGQVK